MMIFLV
jgi:polyadenylate-binding protein